MGSRQRIAFSEQAEFDFNGGNELELDAITAVHADPALFRIGSTITENGGGGGGRTYDHLPTGPGGRRVQMFLEHVEQSEMVRGQTGNPQGSVKWQLSDGLGEADGNMKTVFQLEARTGPSVRRGHEGEILEAFQLGEPQWESLVRQLIIRMAGGDAGDKRFQSGQYVWNYQQGDGSIVMYDTHGSTDESTWTAIWALRRNGRVESFL